MVHTAASSRTAGLAAAVLLALLALLLLFQSRNGALTHNGYHAFRVPAVSQQHLTASPTLPPTPATTPNVTSVVDGDVPEVTSCHTCSSCRLATPTARRADGNDSHPSAYPALPPFQTHASKARLHSHHRLRRHFFAPSQLPGSGRSGAAQGQWLLSQPSRSNQSGLRFAPDAAAAARQATLPHCPYCTGCTAQLKPLRGDKAALHNSSQADLGAAGESIFLANYTSPSSASVRQAVLKVWCLPQPPQPLPAAARHWRNVSSPAAATSSAGGAGGCSAAAHARNVAEHLLAQQQVVRDCGLADINVQLWAAPVNAVDPVSALHIGWTGLWMDVAGGVSAEKLSQRWPPAWGGDPTEGMLRLMNERLNKTQVVRAALHDLLTIQADRHAQNVFIDPSGALKLIDNVQSLQFSWRAAAADSIFLPGTQKFEILRLGGSMVAKEPGARLPLKQSPLLLLDYRCYVPGGRIGRAYPPDVDRCLRKISAMTPRTVMKHYSIPTYKAAALLHTRATDMLTKGFEATLQSGAPLHPPGHRYLWQPPCCRLAASGTRRFECGHEWSPTQAVPFGDPIYGHVWDRSHADPGKFAGGSVFDPADLQAAMQRGAPSPHPRVVISVGGDE